MPHKGRMTINYINIFHQVVQQERPDVFLDVLDTTRGTQPTNIQFIISMICHCGLSFLIHHRKVLFQFILRVSVPL